MLKTVQTPYGAFVAESDDLITNQLQKYGAHTRNELAMIKSFLTEEAVIIDVGAHIGSISVPLVKMLNNKAKVYAFEPNLNSYFLLKHNLYLNRLSNRITCYPYGVSDIEGLRKVRFDSEINNSGSNCLLDSKKTGKHIKFITLDSFAFVHEIKQIDFIKIDVEGRELEVLNGARDIIVKFNPIIYIEICNEQLLRFNTSVAQVLNFLKNHGYEFYHNVGKRNSSNEEFEISKFVSTEKKLFDLLCIVKKD